MKITHLPVFLLSVFLLTHTTARGQYAHFIEAGSIEYERSVNMYAILGKQVRPQNPLSAKFFEAYKSSEPQFHTSTFTLQFSPRESLYSVQELKKPGAHFFGTVAWTSKSEVYTDFEKDSTLISREVYEESYVIKDKQPEILWRMTDETREIAGYLCRRANGLISDSLYVVAFFSTEILPQGGPETFSGLPGMILGVALPHEHVTWFATRVEESKPSPIQPPEIKKGAKIRDRETLLGELKKQVDRWGNMGKIIIKATLL